MANVTPIKNVSEFFILSNGTVVLGTQASSFNAQSNNSNVIEVYFEDGGGLNSTAFINFKPVILSSFPSHDFYLDPDDIYTRTIDGVVKNFYKYSIPIPNIVLNVASLGKNVSCDLTMKLVYSSKNLGTFSTLNVLNSEVPPTEVLADEYAIAYILEETQSVSQGFYRVVLNSVTSVYEWVLMNASEIVQLTATKQYNLGQITIKPGYVNPQGSIPISQTGQNLLLQIINDNKLLFNAFKDETEVNVLAILTTIAKHIKDVTYNDTTKVFTFTRENEQNTITFTLQSLIDVINDLENVITGQKDVTSIKFISGLESIILNYAKLLSYDTFKDVTVPQTYETIANVDIIRGRVTVNENDIDVLETFRDVTVPQTYETKSDANIHKARTTALEDGKEDKSNKVTAFQTTPTDTAYPSEKLVKENLDSKANLVGGNTFTEKQTFSNDVDFNGIVKVLLQIAEFHQGVDVKNKRIRNVATALATTDATNLQMLIDYIFNHNMSGSAHADIRTMIQALQGAYVFRGFITVYAGTEPTPTELNNRITALLSRSPVVGDVLIDNGEIEWYFDGTNWNNMGQAIIALASADNDGLLSKALFVKLSELYSKAQIDSTFATKTNLADEVQALKLLIENLKAIYGWEFSEIFKETITDAVDKLVPVAGFSNYDKVLITAFNGDLTIWETKLIEVVDLISGGGAVILDFGGAINVTLYKSGTNIVIQSTGMGILSSIKLTGIKMTPINASKVLFDDTQTSLGDGNVQDALVTTIMMIVNHIEATANAHKASAISTDVVGKTVENRLEDIETDLPTNYVKKVDNKDMRWVGNISGTLSTNDLVVLINAYVLANGGARQNCYFSATADTLVNFDVSTIEGGEPYGHTGVGFPDGQTPPVNMQKGDMIILAFDDPDEMEQTRFTWSFINNKVRAEDVKYDATKSVKDELDLKASKEEVSQVVIKNAEQDMRVNVLEETLRKVNTGDIQGEVQGDDLIYLGKNVAKAPLQFEIQGRTIPALENKVVNGDFSNGTTGWTASNSTHVVSGGILSNTGNGGGGQPLSLNNTSHALVVDNVLYLVSRQRVTNASATKITLNIGGTTSGAIELVIQSSPVQNQWYVLKGSFKLTSAYVGNLRVILSHAYVDAATANGKVLEADYVMVFNLTASHGVTATSGTAYDNAVADIEAQLKANGGYIDTTPITHTENTELDVMGKNLFDGVFTTETVGTTYTKINDTTFRIQPTSSSGADTINIFPHIKYLPLTRYTFSGSVVMSGTTTSASLRVMYSDGTRVNIVVATTTNTPFTFTTAVDKTVIGITYTFAGTPGENTTYTNFQLEQGTVATTYEPYVSDKQLLQHGRLSKLPNGVADKIRYDNGAYVLDRYVQEYTLLSADIVGLVTSVTNFDFVNINKPTNAIFYGNTTYIGVFENAIRQVGGIGTNGYTDNANRIYYLMPSNNTLYAYAVPKGTYANLAAAQAALAGTKIWYQLATPIIGQPIPTQGLLNGYERGTVRVRSSITYEADIYNGGVTVEDTTKPIKKIDRIYRINGTSYEEINVANATIINEGLGFTHTGLNANDIILFYYFFAEAPINGNVKVKYYNSKEVLVSPNGTLFKRVETVDNAGVITVTAVAI